MNLGKTLRSLAVESGEIKEESLEVFSTLRNAFDNQFGEEKSIEHARHANKHIYLYHGTRTDLDLIRRVGLSIKANGSSEIRIQGKKIWFTPSKHYSSFYGTPLLVKLKTSSLEFVERLPFQKTVNEYVYGSDIPVADIVFPDSPEYDSILKEHSYLHG